MSTTVPSDHNRVWLAMRLGWTLGEVYGRVAENPPPDAPSSSTRLFVSELNPTPNESLWRATQRLVYLTGRLFPPQEAADQKGAKPSATAPAAGPIECPACIEELLQRLEERMAGSASLPQASALYEDLNRWSRQIWVRLDAEDPMLAEAATLGARLADTFWQLPFPSRRDLVPDEQSWQDRWTDLMGPSRLGQMIGQMRQVERNLPAHVGPTVRHSLWEWKITPQLSRSPGDELVIAAPRLHHLRALRWAQKLRKRRTRGRVRRDLQLSVGEQKGLWRQVRHQVTTWEHLIFNRPVDYLLLPSDRQHIRWVTQILYALFVIAILIGGSLLVVGAVHGLTLLLGLLPALVLPTEFKDQLALASAAVAVLAFLLTQARGGVGRLYHLHASIQNWVTARKLEQRGLRPWDGKTKPLRWIWLQRLLRAEDTR